MNHLSGNRNHSISPEEQSKLKNKVSNLNIYPSLEDDGGIGTSLSHWEKL